MMDFDNIGDVLWRFREVGSEGEIMGFQKYLGYKITNRTLVREMIQNSLDADINAGKRKENDPPVELKIKMITLSGEERDFAEKALMWQDVKPHLEAAGEREPTFRGAAEKIDRGEFNILVFEDNNCHGLSGTENPNQHPRDNWYGFVKSANINVKNPELRGSAGGTYGVGKFILWRYAQSSIVCINSTVHREGIPDELDDDGESLLLENPRFIGISRLPGHEFDNRECAGNGYYGRIDWVEDLDSAERETILTEKQVRSFNSNIKVKSVWGEDDGGGEYRTAEEHALALGIDRDGDKTGLSIGVYGYFGPPKSEELDAEHEMAGLKDEVILNFWRQIVDRRLSVNFERYKARPCNTEAEHEDGIEADELKSHKLVGPVVRLYEAYRNGKCQVHDTGRIPDDTICLTRVRTILKARRTGSRDERHGDISVEADLIVCSPTEETLREWLGEGAYEAHVDLQNDAEKSIMNQTGYFRSEGPLINYEDFGMAANTRRFYSLLIAGRARNGPVKEDEHFERFLRFAEDEGHTDWWKRDRNTLQPNYARGFRAEHNEFRERISQRLNAMLATRIEDSDKVRDEFLRFFKFGGGPGPRRQTFKINERNGIYRDGAWDISATIEAPGNLTGKWKRRVVLWRRGDSENTPIAIEAITGPDMENVGMELVGGELHIEAKEDGIMSVPFKVKTAGSDEVVLGIGTRKVI